MKKTVSITLDEKGVIEFTYDKTDLGVTMILATLLYDAVKKSVWHDVSVKNVHIPKIIIPS